MFVSSHKYMPSGAGENIMNRRYYDMTMTGLLKLKKQKVERIHKLLRSGLSKDKAETSKLEEHIVLINAEIAARVDQLPMFQS